ncbi:MAG: RNA methyltransferase [Bacteroidota bacterium]
MMDTLPTAFVQQLRTLLPTEWEALVKALEGTSPASVHLHPHKFPQFTGATEPEAEVPWNPLGRYLAQRPVFTLDPAFHAGAYYVQEASSMLIAAAFRQLFPEQRPLRVLDLCAAPGGKSTLLASHLPPGSWLLANEVIRTRYQVLKYNLVKWGYGNTFTSNHDVTDFAPLAGYFDVVLVDAPCSGEGLFRKDVAARAEWSPEHVAHCAARQGRILAAAQELVAPNGVLLYSTCTYNATENDANAATLAEQTGWSVAPLAFPAAWELEERSIGYQAYPHRLRGEGFYLAAFRKEVGEARMTKAPKSFKKLTRISSKLSAQVQPWLAQPERLDIWATPSGRWRTLAADLRSDAQLLAQHLSRLEVGTPLGEWKGKGLVPAAEWALALDSTTEIATVDVNRAQALALLRKQTPDLPELGKGWHVVRYRGLQLGWVKGLGNRYNNYYPTAWRIRMQ